MNHRPTSSYTRASQKPKVSFRGRALIGIGALFLLTAIGIGYWLNQNNHFPIKAVKVVGTHKFVSEALLNQKITPFVQGGFFGLDVPNLQQTLLNLPWVRRADVRRVWPGQLLIRISEYKATGVWNDHQVITQDLTLISPPEKDLKALTVPHLYGPADKQNVVFETYLDMAKLLAPLNLKIKAVVLADRGAWQIQLQNGLKIILGTQDSSVRIQRFIVAYQTVFHDYPNKIDYVDLRYTSGMAVGWKN